MDYKTIIIIEFMMAHVHIRHSYYSTHLKGICLQVINALTEIAAAQNRAKYDVFHFHQVGTVYFNIYKCNTIKNHFI